MHFRLKALPARPMKGFEQLGNDKIVVRLGGIYALEGVMNTSEEYHRPILEVLSEFVRDGTITEKDRRPPTSKPRSQ